MNKNHASGEDEIAGIIPVQSSVSNSREDADQMNKSALSTAHEYWNLTNEQVIMRDRYGMTIVIDPTNVRDRKPTTREFIIFEHLLLGEGCSFDLANITLGKSEMGDTEHLSKLKQKDIEAWVERQRERSVRSTDTMRKRYRTVISSADLIKGIYVPSIDRVLYLASSRRIYHHPDSVVGKLLQRKNETIQQGYNFNIEIFDGTGNITERWIRQGKMTFKIPVDRSGVHPDGVRVTCTGADMRSTEQFLSLEEANEEIGLFKSREDALGFDEESEIRKRNLELEREIEELKMAAQKESIENKRKEQFYEREKSQRTHENFQEKSETEHNQFKEKSKHEQQVLRNKNVLEFIKFVPAVITAITGLVLVFRKKS